MENLPEILKAFEQTLELERELGTRTVECDRALLAPAPVKAPVVPAASPSTAKPNVAPVVQCPAASVAQPQVREVDFLFMVERPASAAADELLTKMIAAMGYARSQVCVADVTAEAPSAVLSRAYPKCAVVMGSAALKKVFPGEAVRRGTWRALNGVPAIATHHPNEVLRLSAQGARSAKLEVWNVLKLALARLGKTPPAINKKG